MNFFKCASSVLLVLVAAVACDSGDDSGGSGVDKSTQLTALTGADLQKVCDYATEAMTIDPAVSCRASAYMQAGMAAVIASEPLTDATLQAGCESAYDTCMQLVSAATDTPAAEECSLPTGTCTATVAELEECYDAYGPAMEAAYSSIPACSELTVASLTAESTTEAPVATMPAACNALASKCPAALGGSESTSGGDTSGGDTSGATTICADGTPDVSAIDMCDGFDDCVDGSDEAGCS